MKQASKGSSFARGPLPVRKATAHPSSADVLTETERGVGPGGASNLADGERQFRLLVDAVCDYALYMLDPNGTVKSWNAGAQRIKGYTEAEIVGQHFSKFYTPADRSAGVPMQCLRIAVEEGRFEAEAQRVRKDGSPFWANVIIQPIYDDTGALAGFAKITRDITERHENEERLRGEIVVRRQAEQDARAAKTRLLDAIDSIDDGFALYDAEDKLVVHNVRYLELHPSIRPLVVRGVNFESLVRAGLDCGHGPLVQPSESEVEARLARHRRADGKASIQNRDQRWLMTSERPTREGGVVVVETDITALKKADAAKDEFLAKISHELRTPLTPISGALALVASGKIAELPPKLHKLVDMASHNCERLMSIVNDLLDFTRINTGNFSLDAELVEIEPFLDQVIQNRLIGPKPPAIELRVDPRVKDAELEADPTRIQQVLDNLLSNAIKYASTGDPIEVTAERRGRSLRVSVADHGPGIPAEFASQVFDAFAQADSSSTRRQGGVGLGLSICKSIVEAHGGTIGFTSKEGKGTTFYFDLPLKTLGGAKGKQPSKQAPRGKSEGDGLRGL